MILVEGLLIEIVIDTLCRPGTGNRTPYFTILSNKMSQIIVQDVWFPRTSPGDLADSNFLRQDRLAFV